METPTLCAEAVDARTQKTLVAMIVRFMHFPPLVIAGASLWRAG
jgi:hypothetical protein